MKNLTTTNKNISEIIQDNMMGYASYVLLDRCLPDMRDGMKPVHRRVLYAMNKQKTFKLTKSANVAGYVMRYHPHGSAYGTMVGMVQKDRHATPLLEGKGNFGQYTSRDLAPAADRYSEVKLSDIAVDMMKNFDKGLVDFVKNYDGTLTMPEVLPVKFPSILAYANSGIGVGFSSSIPSFNLSELCDATEERILKGTSPLLIPDFPTGGTIVKDEESFRAINEQGRGSVKIRGKATIVGNTIEITEIPFTTTREAIIEKVVALNKEKKLPEVTDVKDLTGLKGMKIVVYCRKNVDVSKVLEKLYKFTPLQSSYSANMNMLVDGLPKVLGVEATIDHWIAWRREVILRGLSHDIKNMSDKLHLLRGLEKVLVDVDKAIQIIRTSEEDLIEQNIALSFGIDEVQAKEVSDMKLRNINESYIKKKIRDTNKLAEQIEQYKKIQKDEDLQNQIIVNGLRETKQKYGYERNSEIEELSNTPVVHLEVEQPDYSCVLYLTKEGYAYKGKRDFEPTLKPGDEVINRFETENKSQILVFDTETNCHKFETSKIEETKPNSLGTYLPSLSGVDMTIFKYSILDKKNKILIAAYTNNRLTKIDLTAYEGNRKMLKNAYNPRQDLVDLITLPDEQTLEITTDKTKVKVDTKNLSLTRSRNATGVYVTRKGTLKKVKVA